MHYSEEMIRRVVAGEDLCSVLEDILLEGFNVVQVAKKYKFTYWLLDYPLAIAIRLYKNGEEVAYVSATDLETSDRIWHITRSEVHPEWRGKGIGKLSYVLIMDFLTRSKNAWLIPSVYTNLSKHHQTSTAAQRVWLSFNKMSEVKKEDIKIGDRTVVGAKWKGPRILDKVVKRDSE